MIKHISKFFKSPLTHFILIGIITYFLYIYILPPTSERIVVTRQTIDALIQQQESITQNPLTETEIQNLIAGHIEEEILLREAYKRGFDKNDYRVRKRILNIMRTSLSEVIPEPSIAQLKKYYEENKERYLGSPSVSFDQVFFSFSSTMLPEIPADFIRTLNRSNDPGSLGEFSMLGNKFVKNSFSQIAITLGKPFAEKIFDMPVNQWEGPIESFRGIHYVRVIGKHDPEIAPFDQMENYLRTDYQLTKMRESQERKIEELGTNYEIIVEGEE